MKVVVTANAAWNVANFRSGLIKSLQDEGHSVVVVSPSDRSVKALLQLGVRHVLIRMDPKGTAPYRDARLIADFRRIFRAERPDVVLSYTIKNNIYGGLAANALSIPFLPNVSGLGTAFLNAGWLEKIVTRLYRAAFRKLPFVIFQNTDDRDLFIERQIIRSDQAALVPGSGIDLTHFQPTPPPNATAGGMVFLLIARLLRDKGVEEFVGAAREVKKSYPNANFQLLGPTGTENRTAIDRATVDNWVEEGVIEYLGETDNVRPKIAAADCIVLPSYREGTPRTLLEAAAMARPLIATDVPGCREVVDHEKSGYLCRVKDAKDLAAQIIRMIEIGPAARISMGQAGFRKMKKEFDQQLVFDIYRDLISRLTSFR